MTSQFAYPRFLLYLHQAHTKGIPNDSLLKIVIKAPFKAHTNSHCWKDGKDVSIRICHVQHLDLIF